MCAKGIIPLLPARESRGEIPSFSPLVNCLESQFFGSHDPKYPPLNCSDIALLRRQWRMKEISERAVKFGTLQPRRSGVGSLFIAVTAFLRQASVVETAETIQLYAPRTASLQASPSPEHITWNTVLVTAGKRLCLESTLNRERQLKI